MFLEERVYHPELLPRQGEINAWLLAFFASTALVLLHLQGVVPFWSWFFVGFLFLSAASISLGNWMDRHTALHLGQTGVAFENGLRRVQLAWNEIDQVRVLPARWGERIQVIGAKSHFEFTMPAEVKFNGQIKGRVGFLQGKEILASLLQASGLTNFQKTDEYAYYSRL